MYDMLWVERPGRANPKATGLYIWDLWRRDRKAGVQGQPWEGGPPRRGLEGVASPTWLSQPAPFTSGQSGLDFRHLPPGS